MPSGIVGARAHDPRVMAASPDADQRAASKREARRQYAADATALEDRPRARTRQGWTPEMLALVVRAEAATREGWRGCRHLAARQPVYWRPEAPHTLLCRTCDPGVDLASRQCAACGQLASDPEDLTVVRWLAGEVTITASLCEVCHPTSGL
jgi:hypothetical protein